MRVGQAWKSIHLARWALFIWTKKNTGGLRLHVIRALNDAYLIKLRWCLVAGSEELWARVLSFKYSKGGFYSTYKIKSLSLTYPMCGRAFSKTCTPRVTLKA